MDYYNKKFQTNVRLTRLKRTNQLKRYVVVDVVVSYSLAGVLTLGGLVVHSFAK